MSRVYADTTDASTAVLCLIVLAVVAGAAIAWSIIGVQRAVRDHHRSEIRRLRILEAVKHDGGMTAFEINLSVARDSDEVSDVRAELESLVVEGLVRRVPVEVDGRLPPNFRHRYHLA